MKNIDRFVSLLQEQSPLAVGVWGDFDPTPVPSAAQSGVTAIAAGYDHIVALKNDGSVVAWGNNSFGGRVLASSFAHRSD